jgi:hypothetical protein
MGKDRVLTIPRNMKYYIKSDWMKVTISSNGVPVYEPIPISEDTVRATREYANVERSK